MIDYLSQFITAERQAKIEAVLDQRTRYITLVAEDFHFSQNSNAVLRTAEGLGIQDMHIIDILWHLSDEEKNHLRLNWLTMSSRSSEALIGQFLKQKGYNC